MKKKIMVLLAVNIISAGCGSGTGGSAASSSSGLQVSSGLTCSKIDTGTGASLIYKYESVVYNNGDRLVTCEVDGPAAGYSSTDYFISSQTGSKTGLCQVTADLDTATAGYWTFTSQNSVTQVVYNDVGSSHNGYTYTFASTDCTAF